MQFKGQVLKMTTQYAEPIQYYLNLSGDILHVNQLIGKKLSLKHVGYQCINCGKEESTNEKPYRMGYCRKCFFESPYAGDFIIRPELSKAHLGIEDRDLEVEKELQLQPHIVYLAHTGDVKVGVTRERQVPTRWVDQGATFALPIARTTNRYEAGVIEVALKEHLSDKTNYRKMLQDQGDQEVDLESLRNQVQAYLPEESQSFFLQDSSTWALHFPFQPIEKVNSFTLDKNPSFEGVLTGIKGQYLAFEGGNVMNVRSHEGYVIELETL